MNAIEQRKPFPKALLVSWWFAYLPLAALEGRFLYEQIWLTYTRGEQMIGFTMVHQFPLLLIVGLAGWLGCFVWCVIALMVLVKRRHEMGITARIQFSLAAVTLLLMCVPVDSLVLKLR